MVVPLIINALTQRRISGGGFVANTPVAPANCPVPGSGAGQLVFHADQVFTSAYPAYPDWSGVLGAEDAFGAPDSVGWLWVAAEAYPGVMSGIRFQAEPGWLACPNMTIAGGTMEVFYIDAVDADIRILMFDNALTDPAGAITTVNGAGSTSLTFNATQAAGLLDGSYQSAVIFDPAEAFSETAQIRWDAVRWTIDYVA